MGLNTSNVSSIKTEIFNNYRTLSTVEKKIDILKCSDFEGKISKNCCGNIRKNVKISFQIFLNIFLL